MDRNLKVGTRNVLDVMKEIRQEITPDVWDPLFGNTSAWGTVGTQHINVWLAHNTAFGQWPGAQMQLKKESEERDREKAITTTNKLPLGIMRMIERADTTQAIFLAFKAFEEMGFE